MIKVKSIFSGASEDDGFRVLIEPVWPGMASRDKLALDVWFRDLAPSPELYSQYAKNMMRWEDFVVRYHSELDEREGYFKDLQAYNLDGGLTIVHGSCNEDHNIAVAVKMYMEKNDPAPEKYEPGYIPAVIVKDQPGVNGSIKQQTM